MRLPAVKKLVKEIESKKVANALSYLLDRRSELKEYEDIEDLVLSDAWESEQRLQGLERNIVMLRAALARTLWKRGVYIGVTVLDELIFGAIAHSETTDPVRVVLERIRDYGLHRPGLVIYPLHSMGILGAGLFQWETRANPTLYVPDFGLAVHPQTNSIDATFNFVKFAAESLGVRQDPPSDLIEHWFRSRASWLASNPLLIARVSSFPGQYYENQYFLTARLQLATSLLFMTSALQKEQQEGDLVLGSSARINNFQTLDIRHYIVLFQRPGSKALLGDCVPMNIAASSLSELCELSVEIDPRYWRTRKTIVKRISVALETVGSLYAMHAMLSSKNALKARVARKLFASLKHFRRSHRQMADPFDAIVNLAVAFELLLSDHYAPGIANHVTQQAKKAIGRRPGSRALVQSVNDVYVARGECVHQGTWPDVDLNLARRAFVYAFVGLVEKLPNLPRTSPRPISDILSGTAY